MLKLIFIMVICLTSVNKIRGLLRNGERTAKLIIYCRPSLNVSFILLQKGHTQNFHPTPLSKTLVQEVRVYFTLVLYIGKVPEIRGFFNSNLNLTNNVQA